MSDRGFHPETVETFGLGFVAEPTGEHTAYAGMLSIPYLRWNARGGSSVVDLRFRCLRDGCPPGCDHGGMGKYMSLPAAEPHLFNTAALGELDTIAVCEGELDAITATAAGVPAVAAPGATTWQPHYAELFDGFATVYVLADGDKAGREFAKTVLGNLRQGNGELRAMPDKEDVNSFVLAHGGEALRRRVLGDD